jgi:hypothetical protein
MKNLPIYSKTLLLQGASITGKFTEGYYFVEEKIKIKDAKILFEFCQWIDSKIGGASAYNIDMLFTAFINPTNVELNKQANELATKIRAIKSL